MKKTTKQIIAGIAMGAFVLTMGVGAYAADAPQDEKPNVRVERQAPQMNKDEFAAAIAEEYGIKKDEVLKAVNDNTNFRDIGQAAMFAKLSGKSFSGVLNMKSDWRDVAKKLGISAQDIKKEQARVAAVRIAKHNGLDETQVQKLLNDGYMPGDIQAAAQIAKASGKDINTVLSARKINNQWRDVAKEFGISEEQMMQGRHGDKPMMRERGIDKHNPQHDGRNGKHREHDDDNDND